MYFFSIGSGSTNSKEHYSKWEDPAVGINLSAESNVGFFPEISDIWASRSTMDNTMIGFVTCMSCQ